MISAVINGLASFGVTFLVVSSVLAITKMKFEPKPEELIAVSLSTLVFVLFQGGETASWAIFTIGSFAAHLDGVRTQTSPFFSCRLVALLHAAMYSPGRFHLVLGSLLVSMCR